MSWNIRIMKHTTPNDDVWYGLHEVYYNGEGQIVAWTEDVVPPTGDTPLELLSYIILMLRAFWKSRHDILDHDMEPEGNWSFYTDDEEIDCQFFDGRF